MSDIIDEIDALVDEQLAGGPQDDYSVNRYDKCWHCRRDWHGMPITERIEEMRIWGTYDETYRVDTDDSPVICPGSDFIGPMPPPRRTTTVQVGTPGELLPPESRERWWRIHLPIDAEIEHRRAGHYMERNTTTLTIGERSATWPTENVIVSREPAEEVQMFQAEALIRIPPPGSPDCRRARRNGTRHRWHLGATHRARRGPPPRHRPTTPNWTRPLGLRVRPARRRQGQRPNI